ncbi:unnamed protein product [Arabidopsis halleri]
MVCGYEGMVLPLKRMIHLSHELDLTQLGAFDSSRHGRMLQSPVHRAFNFPVERDANRLLSALYYTTLQIRTPPREFNVVIDTEVMFYGLAAFHASVALSRMLLSSILEPHQQL